MACCSPLLTHHRVRLQLWQHSSFSPSLQERAVHHRKSLCPCQNQLFCHVGVASGFAPQKEQLGFVNATKETYWYFDQASAPIAKARNCHLINSVFQQQILESYQRPLQSSPAQLKTLSFDELFQLLHSAGNQGRRRHSGG